MDNIPLLEGVFNVLGALPHGHDKPVKHAIYNALAIFLLVICCGAAWALFIILEPFIKPLTWAVLVGSVLHPFKYSLAQRFRFWFSALDKSGTPIFIGVLLLPLNVLSDLSDVIGSKILAHWKPIVAVTTIILFGNGIYFLTPGFLVGLFYKAFNFSTTFMLFFIHNVSLPIVVVIIIFYGSIMILLWSPKNNNKFHLASIGIWILFSGYLANICTDSVQLPLFIFLQTIFVGGFLYEVYNVYEEMHSIGHSNTSLHHVLSLVFKTKPEYDQIILDLNNEINVDKSVETSCDSRAKISDKSTTESVGRNTIRFADEAVLDKETINKPKTLSVTSSYDDRNQSGSTQTSLIITDKGRVHLIKQPSSESRVTCPTEQSKIRRSQSQPVVTANNLSFRAKLGIFNWKRRASKSLDDQSPSVDCSSDFYIYSVLWACMVMLFWKNVMLLPILPIPICIGIIKYLGNYFGLWKLISALCQKTYESTYDWCGERYDGILPVPVRGIYRTLVKVHLWAKSVIRDSIDTVASCLVILGLIVFVTCASIFIFIQIYTEALMLVQMTSNVINQTVVHNPELRQLFPPTFDDTVDSILDNAYQYGREGISNLLKSVMTDVDPAKSEKLEKQVLELWDRVYQTWMSSNDANGPKVTSSAVESSWNAFMEDLQKSPEMFNLNGIVSFLKQNIGTLMSLMDSVWTIVIGNISLVVGSFSALVSILFGGGTAVLNFILNVIIFLTTLFYLLSSSGRLYKPIELLTTFSTSSSRFGLALGGAINGVFIASFKMAAFYGMWTWLIHNLFGLKIIYLPSAFATILGAAPFLGTYWACIPGILDLWLAQGNGLHAILFAICQFLPTSIVDTTIYAEINGGGHPYLTGLAIAGGIFCLGLEGAIIGPLVLCALYVAVDLSTSLFKDSPSEESLNLQQLSRLQLEDC